VGEPLRVWLLEKAGQEVHFLASFLLNKIAAPSQQNKTYCVDIGNELGAPKAHHPKKDRMEISAKSWFKSFILPNF
jgi:hypothetical protein